MKDSSVTRGVLFIVNFSFSVPSTTAQANGDPQAALVAGSVNVSMLVTTRILHGFGLGMILCLVPLYTTEIAPPKTRGIYSGMTVIGYGMGYLM